MDILLKLVMRLLSTLAHNTVIVRNSYPLMKVTDRYFHKKEEKYGNIW